MYPIMNPHPVQPTAARTTPPNMVGLMIAASLLFGGLSGGLISYLLTTSGGTTTSTTGGLKTVKVEEESATTEVVKKTSPAVVSIIATKDYSEIYGNQPLSPFDLFFGQQPRTGTQQVSSGSGFIVRANGLIVTNKHVINDDQADYTVVMNDGKKYDAKVLAKDPVNDIAVIKVEATDLPTLELGDSDKVQIGQTVIAIGNALGQYRNTVTKGVISGKARTIVAGDGNGSSETLNDVFQTDASINPGNSGGPLIDLGGSVVAMNTAVDSQGQLIGFAIPINVIKKDVESVDKTGKIVQPFLGVRYVLVTKAMADQNKFPTDEGALISKDTEGNDPAVVAGSPADKAGLKENDIIAAINGDKITADHPLVNILAKYRPGDKITVTIYRGGEKQDVSVTLEERKESE